MSETGTDGEEADSSTSMGSSSSPDSPDSGSSSSDDDSDTGIKNDESNPEDDAESNNQNNEETDVESTDTQDVNNESAPGDDNSPAEYDTEIVTLPEPVTESELYEAHRPGEMIDGSIRVVIYYRTSKDNDDDTRRISIDQQEPLAEAAVDMFGAEPAREPITDKGISGEVFPRPGLEKIEQLAEEGEIDAVIVSDIDRLGRTCEKTIEFAKRLRDEYGVYVIANMRWYDIADGDDLETFCGKAGRAEAENKKRGDRGNRGKLVKVIKRGSDAYLSWFRTIPMGYVKQVDEDDENYDDEMGIESADDYEKEIPQIVFEEFITIDLDRLGGPYARTEERVRTRLEEELEIDTDNIDFDAKKILTNPVYTGRAVIEVKKPQTHSVDKAEIGVEMSDLQLIDPELWNQTREKIERLNQRYKNKNEGRPESLLNEFGVKPVDEALATWTLICPDCGGTNYEYYGTKTDADGTERQKCKCKSCDRSPFFRAPTRGEYEELKQRSREN